MASTESKIPVGQILVGKYRVVREIGRGGMAAVYEAEQLSLGKKVAVKVLAAELSASTIVIERFFREARAAASVRSPYIVDVYDSGRLDDGRPFIAMELLEGESLYDRMARVRIIDIETTIRVIVHTARGLVKAHAAGIVHRDLKPENIFLTKGEDGDDVCKILDFGLAKFYAPVNPEEKSQKRLTREGAVFGTPAYMSPEQVKGQGTVDHRADLWALGCMAFECLIGRPVWNMDQGVAMTFAAIATGPIPVPSQIRSDLPPAFDAWFKKCLERDPNRRYQSAKELADAFVEAWGQDRLKTSSASFPSFALTGGSQGRGVAAVGYEAQEIGGDVLESVRPGPGALPVPGRPAPVNGAGLYDPSSAAVPLQRLLSTDVPATSDPDTPLPRRKPSPVRLAISGAFLAGSMSLMIFVWFRFLGPQVLAPVVQSTATAPPSAIPSGTPPPAPTDQPKWLPIISEGQRRFTQSDVKGAQEKFQEAIALGPPASVIGKVFYDQIKLTTIPKETKGRCKPVAFARPRLSFDRRAERPAIVTTSKGYLVTWTDDHEQKDKDHVYGVLLDPTGKSLGAIRDLTPEASDAQRPQLVPQSADRTVLLWWDAKGREAGVRVRLLDADGRIDPSKGNAVLVGAARPGDYWPSIEKGPNGFFVVWQDDRDKEKEYDLFVRRLTPDLDTFGPETRLTDYYAPPKSKTPPPRIRYPSAVVAANTLLVAYRLERERDREVWRLKVGLDELDRGGLPESKENPRDSRVLGDAVRISDERLPADAPDIACSNEGCFVVWHGEPNGVWVAGIDPNGGLVQWHKKIAEKGGHPSIAVNGNQVAVAYYEGSKEKEGARLKMAFLSRDGVATPSTIFRVHDEKAPRPSLAPGVDPNEWVLAWQDSDAPKGSAEIFAARVLCR